jgi:DNA polymerase
MCRPPGNRDPYPHELEACQHYLFAKLELIQPTMICTLGNFATKLLRGEPTGISRIHGQAEVRTIGPRAVRLYPLYHPAAALYTPSTLEMLQADFLRIPEILRMGPPDQPEPSLEAPPPEDSWLEGPPPEDAPPAAPQEPQPAVRDPPPADSEQLGLF